jgi:hypothetical protein
MPTARRTLNVGKLGLLEFAVTLNLLASSITIPVGVVTLAADKKAY